MAKPLRYPGRTQAMIDDMRRSRQSRAEAEIARQKLDERRKANIKASGADADIFLATLVAGFVGGLRR